MPAPELPDTGQPGAIVWGRLGAGDGFEGRAPAEHPGIEPQVRRGTIAGSLEPLDPRLERRIARLAGDALHAGQLGLRERDGAAHTIEQGGAVPCSQAGRKCGDPAQLRRCTRQGLGHGEEGIVPDDAERGPILLGGQGLAPQVQLPQRRQLSGCERLGPFHAQERVRSSGPSSTGSVGRPPSPARPTEVFEPREFLLRPYQPAERDEPGAQLLAQRR